MGSRRGQVMLGERRGVSAWVAQRGRGRGGQDRAGARAIRRDKGIGDHRGDRRIYAGGRRAGAGVTGFGTGQGKAYVLGVKRGEGARSTTMTTAVMGCDGWWPHGAEGGAEGREGGGTSRI